MLLSEFERKLADLRRLCGDAEVHEALAEYGEVPFTDETFERFVRFEEHRDVQAGVSRFLLVIGRH